MRKLVIWIGDLDEDGNCPICAIDYADCDCPGPSMEDEYDYDYEWEGDDLYATPKVIEDESDL